MKLNPLADRVIVEPDSQETTTKSGIIIPETAQEKPRQGVILAVGPGKVDVPMTVKVGDRVLFGEHSGTKVTVEGKDVLIMSEGELYCTSS